VEIAANLAVITFNSGRGALRSILKNLDLPCGPTTARANNRGLEVVKKRRQQMRLYRVAMEEGFIRTDGAQVPLIDFDLYITLRDPINLITL